MYARKVVPILLIAGGVMMIMHHKRLELMGQGEGGEQSHPSRLNGPTAIAASGASAFRRCSRCGTSAPTSRSKPHSSRPHSQPPFERNKKPPGGCGFSQQPVPLFELNTVQRNLSTGKMYVGGALAKYDW